MNDDEIAELLRYSSPKELYIVSWNNLLQILFCPFKVIVLDGIGELKQGEFYWVEEVKVTRDLTTVFLIKNQAYFYHHFDFVLD